MDCDPEVRTGRQSVDEDLRQEIAKTAAAHSEGTASAVPGVVRRRVAVEEPDASISAGRLAVASPRCGRAERPGHGSGQLSWLNNAGLRCGGRGILAAVGERRKEAAQRRDPRLLAMGTELKHNHFFFESPRMFYARPRTSAFSEAVAAVPQQLPPSATAPPQGAGAVWSGARWETSFGKTHICRAAPA
jgi:hypothetical protein